MEEGEAQKLGDGQSRPTGQSEVIELGKKNTGPRQPVIFRTFHLGKKHKEI